MWPRGAEILLPTPTIHAHRLLIYTDATLINWCAPQWTCLASSACHHGNRYLHLTMLYKFVFVGRKWNAKSLCISRLASFLAISCLCESLFLSSDAYEPILYQNASREECFIKKHCIVQFMFLSGDLHTLSWLDVCLVIISLSLMNSMWDNMKIMNHKPILLCRRECLWHRKVLFYICIAMEARN